ncbi:S1 family peptidase [Nocardia sp. NBC_01503]|uniref:S1 family peptidase n=1 Tax=Nocardia sp. NBC_01503 TaxID=2975997 RepID=UPI002E7B7771|nr:S1 family peptidase [Nocardia sp. NBC_01503]WTL34632.1 S1 family peptidase [Nocardia sp. NBC_01503]
MFVTGRARMLSWAAIAVTALSTTVLFSGTADAAPPVTLGGGSGIYVEQLDDPNSTADCTLTSIGYDRDGKLVGITAGHCGEVGARIAAEYTRSGGIGVISEKSAGNDWAVIVFDPARVNPTKQVAQSVINSVGAPPAIGDIACKNGRTTGYTCGPVWETTPNWFRSQVCANHGDSGAPVLLGDRLVGMVVAGTDFDAGPVSIELPACKGAGDLIHEPELSTTISMVLADIDRHGGAGAGFRPF